MMRPGRSQRIAFEPTAGPVALGHGYGLGLVEPYGLSRTVTLIVGLDRGQMPHNRRGHCARMPRKLPIQRVDRAVLAERSERVRAEFVGATRTVGRGFFQGKVETSASYLFVWVPPDAGGSPNEPSFAIFKRNLEELAENLARRLCQDQILVLTDTGRTRTAAGASWSPHER